MSHEFVSGFSVREAMWHGLGTVRADYPGSWLEVKQEAGLMWEPESHPVFDLVGGKPQPIEGWHQVKRSDTGLRLIIAPATRTLISHDTMGEIFEAVMGTRRDYVRYETAGVLDEGRKVWLLARLGDAVELPGDPSALQPYLAILNSHDGSAALRVIATAVRIVCMNTWHAADMDASIRGSAYAFKHTKNWQLKVEDCKQALANTDQHIDKTVQRARELLAVQVTAAQRTEWIKQFAINRVIANTIGKTPHTRQKLEERLAQPRVQESMHHTIHTLTAILEGPTCAGIAGTMWGLVQAGGEFADHYRDTENEGSLFSRTMLADKEPLKQMAIRTAREVVRTV